MSKTKSKGLRNPAAIAAVPIVADQAGKAGKAAGKRADKINADTNGALSWAIVAMVALGLYGVWKITAPLRAAGGAAGDAIDGAAAAIKDLFKEDFTTGGGYVSDLVDPAFKPAGATINVTQASNLASQLFTLFDGYGQLNENEKQQVYAIFLNKNAVDNQMISAAFGRPRRNPILGDSGNVLIGEKKNLQQWVLAEMGQASVNFLKTITHGIF